MTHDAHQKVKASHLKRNAYLYVRQSTLRQVFENTESTQRQYALRQHAVALGWPLDRIIVIDTDLGQSGASAADREGFQRLVTEVSLGRAGIVLGLEVSRLARNSMDWHRLLEICALADTLILDEVSVAAKKGAIMAGRKGPAVRLRDGLLRECSGAEIHSSSLWALRAVAVRQLVALRQLHRLQRNVSRHSERNHALHDCRNVQVSQEKSFRNL